MYIEEQTRAHICGLQKDLRVIHAASGDTLPPVSGVYDSLTEEAIREFQARHGLPITGKTDLSTWDRVVHEANLHRSRTALPLAVRVFPHATLTVGMGDSGRFVYILQAMLNGFTAQLSDLLPLPYTGVYDPPTARVVSTLQQSAGLPATGKINAETWNMLAQLYSHFILHTENILD